MHDSISFRTMLFKLMVNGRARSVRVEPSTPLLYVLRNDLKLNGAKFGCGQARCGESSIVIGRAEQRSCISPGSAAGKGSTTTIEGRAPPKQPSALHRPFIARKSSEPQTQH